MSAILLLIVVLAAANVEASPTCSKKLDLTFVVDGSASVCVSGTGPCPQWNAILKFCKNIVNGLTIGTNDARVAFVTINDHTQTEWDLEKYTEKLPLLQAIDNVPFRAGELLEVLTVSEIVIDVFNPLKGDRIDVQNIGILITDGAPNFLDWVYAAQSIAVQKTRGVGVFVVCLTPGCTEQCGKDQSSPPQKVNESYYLINDYLNIDQIRDTLVTKFCAIQVKDPLAIF